MFSAEQVAAASLQDNSEARRRFLSAHGDDAAQVVAGVALFYRHLGECSGKWRSGDRTAVVTSFLHLAGHAVVSSLNLLVQGLIAPSGNLMRHYSEALAMSLLCSVERPKVLESWLRDPDSFPIHKAVSRMQRHSAALAEALDFDIVGWRAFEKGMALFDEHSHANQVALAGAASLALGQLNLLLGPEYDSGKAVLYERELKFRLKASRDLDQVILAIDRHLRP